MGDAITNDDLMSHLRTARDGLLKASDVVVLRSVETGEPVPDEWKAYRQALRDLPDTTIDPASPVWPLAPEA